MPEINQFPGDGTVRQSKDFEFAALAEASNYRAAIARLFAPHLQGDVLEIGAGIGQMLQDVMSICRPASITALEPDERFAGQLRKNFPGIKVIEGKSGELTSTEEFDAVIAVNVLEHIREDADELLLWYRQLKPQKGRLCLLVPARPEIYSPIDADFGHFRRYTRAELVTKLKQVGFQIHYAKYYNFVGYFAWLINFKLLRRRLFDPAAVKTFDRYIFPSSHRIEQSIGWCPFGQSLVAVAQT